jgi:hypothetical protein
MRAVSLIDKCWSLAFALPLVLALAPSAFAAHHYATPLHRWSCADVPYWIRSYSPSTVASTAANMGMARWEIIRLLKCLPKQ